MNPILRLVQSSIGCKTVMALTGVGLLGFVVQHLLGNLKIYQGAEALNEYAEFLHSLPPPIFWGARLGILSIFLLHMGAAFRLHLLNRAARPVPYDRDTTLEASWASRHMILTGVVILAFVVFHLLHFTVRVVPVGETTTAGADLYTIVVSSFREGWVAFSYIGAMLILGLHLIHGASSLFQTLGLRSRKVSKGIYFAGAALTVLLVLGNCSIPLMIFLQLGDFALTPGG